ncbi:hypothetical protein GCM10009811_16820 [Nostocoides veronense]|uniref:Mop domain-containing protein n=2 Tax=Nostocoides veronense TaxID=330836 RepID=A0ABN2LM83_9MICO
MPSISPTSRTQPGLGKETRATTRAYEESAYLCLAIRICGHMLSLMPHFRIKEAADLLGVSDDTMRRWVEQDRVSATADDSGKLAIAGDDLARLAHTLAEETPRPKPRPVVAESARNRFVGLVTRVVKDTVMAQVEMQSGPHRIVSLMSREAADELGLEPGVLATASVKSTNVIIELPEQP